MGSTALSVSKLDVNDILNMPAGPEMDAIVAKEVMGYAVAVEESPSSNGEAGKVWFIVTSDNGHSRNTIPEFSTDIGAALKVGEKMRSDGDEVSLQHRNMVENAPGTSIWTAWFGRASDLAWGVTPPLAICRAALLALRSREETAPVRGESPEREDLRDRS